MQRVNIAIASPSDVAAERNSVPKIFNRWNNGNEHAFLHPVMWESASVPELGDHPQHILNRTIIEKSELLVAILWSKLGTPTPTATSGTVEEIREFIASKGPRRVMLYFCTRDLPYSGVNPTELAKLQEFKTEMRSRGLYHEYQTVAQFEGDLYAHLDTKVQQLLDGELSIPSGPAEFPKGTLLPDKTHADARLHQPIDFGTTVQAIANGFAARMDEFDAISGSGPNKYLALGAHVYHSVAICLDRALISPAERIGSESRAFIQWVSERLKSLAETYKDYAEKPFPEYWKEGRTISNELSGHTNERQRRIGKA